MRAQEIASGPETGGSEPARAQADAVILSGVGISAAMSAYGEVIDAGGE
jgi:hypothetical protein